MVIQFCKSYLPHSKVLVLLSLLLQPWCFDTKITSEKNSYLDEVWFFIGRFKVESVPGMINEALTQLI